MKQLLYVDCCIRADASRTKQLADAFLHHLKEDWQVTHLELLKLGIGHFDTASLSERDALLAAGDLSHPRFDLARQFAAADAILIAAPFWDLSFPALLKVYIENVSVDGITFHSDEEGLKGLCRAENMFYLTTRGGFYEGSDMEMGSRYMEALSRFFGIGRYDCVAADGMDVKGFAADRSLLAASSRAAMLAWNL